MKIEFEMPEFLAQKYDRLVKDIQSEVNSTQKKIPGTTTVFDEQALILNIIDAGITEVSKQLAVKTNYR